MLSWQNSASRISPISWYCFADKQLIELLLYFNWSKTIIEQSVGRHFKAFMNQVDNALGIVNSLRIRALLDVTYWSCLTDLTYIDHSKINVELSSPNINTLTFPALISLSTGRMLVENLDTISSVDLSNVTPLHCLFTLALLTAWSPCLFMTHLHAITGWLVKYEL